MLSIPDLVVKPNGLGLRALALVSRGVRQVANQVEPYTHWWSDQNQEAARQTGPLWVVLGDSTSIGIGASAADKGYVGLVRNELRRDDPAWRVINLAMSGARVIDGLERQLPILDHIVQTEQTGRLEVTICLGSNDVFWERGPHLRERLRTMVSRLPEDSHVAMVAGVSERAKLANRTLRSAADEFGHSTLNPWNEPGNGHRLADDKFHPNDLGYHYISQAYARALGVPGPTATDQ